MWKNDSMHITRVPQNKARQRLELLPSKLPSTPQKNSPVTPPLPHFHPMARENGDFLQLDRHDNYYISGGDIVFLVRCENRRNSLWLLAHHNNHRSRTVSSEFTVSSSNENPPSSGINSHYRPRQVKNARVAPIPPLSSSATLKQTNLNVYYGFSITRELTRFNRRSV
jgi:hypothetical protein